MGRLIQYLRLKWLWVKAVYPFYWAHKPLCSHFHGETIRVGKVHLCRSCSCVWSSLIIGISVFLIFSIFQELALPTFLTILGFVLLLFLASFPGIYKKWPRQFRDILRMGMGLTLAIVLTWLIEGHWTYAVPTLLIGFIFWRFYFAKRKSRRLETCKSCPEYQESHNKPCSGYAMQYQRLLDFDTNASNLLMQTQRIPKCLQKSKTQL